MAWYDQYGKHGGHSSSIIPAARPRFHFLIIQHVRFDLRLGVMGVATVVMTKKPLVQRRGGRETGRPPRLLWRAGSHEF